MKVTINGVNVELQDGSSLSQLLELRSVKPSGIATAVNGMVIKATDRESHKLADGDAVTVIRAFYGG